MNPALCVMLEIPPARRASLAGHYETHDWASLSDDAAAQVRAVVTNGTTGLTAAQMARLPRLELVCCMGAGFEGVDVDAARARGIAVTHGPGVNDATVADHAMALLLALLRNIPTADRGVRAGEWHKVRVSRPQLAGKRMGIFGLGRIGLRIARRAEGFDVSVAYHNRRRREDVAYPWHDSLMSLAEASDVLVLASPGGPETRHAVDGAVLAALGPAGYLVNIGRGSVVDTAALVAALTSGAIAGAGLDVMEGEPAPGPALLAAPNLVLTPHMAGNSPESTAAGQQLLLDNLAAHFAGRPLLSPVP